MELDVQLSQSSQIDACAELMHQLRVDLPVDVISQRIRGQMQSDYQLAHVVKNEVVVCVAGFRIAHNLAWGKHLYVDDLVTCQSSRSLGVGKTMLDWLEGYAKQHQCTQLHLDSGVMRFGAHKFYLQAGFVISSHHFAKVF